MNIGTVHIIRHAEGIHNTRRDTTILDPELSPNGIQEARELRDTFPFNNRVGIIMTSPLRRALETTIEGFGHVLDRATFLPESRVDDGVDAGIKLLLEPKLQAHSARPCDTGSAVPSPLQELFPGVSLAGLASDWHIKEGVNAPDEESLHKRAHLVRQQIIEQFNELAKLGEENPRRDIVIVGHHGFSRYLLRDPKFNPPGATWKTFRVLLSKNNSDVTFEEIYIES